MRPTTSILIAGMLFCSGAAFAHEIPDNQVNSGTNRSSESVAKRSAGVVRDGTSRAEFGNECAWGLANGQHVTTDCSVKMTRQNGRTYCFSNDRAMDAFMNNPSRHLSAAAETYGRS